MPSRSEAGGPLRQAIRGLAEVSEGHPSPEEIAAYREGTGGPERADEIREHLAGCPECTTELLELDALFAADPQPGAEMSASELEAAWARQRARGLPSSRAFEPAAPHREPRRRRFPIGTLTLGLAASIFALITVMQWRRIVELERPRANLPLVQLVPIGSVRQWAATVPTLRLAEGQPWVWLILNPETDLDFAAYDIEMTGPGNGAPLRFVGVRSSDAGTFRLEVSRGSLESGHHRIVLYGHRGTGRRVIAEFEFHVSGSLE
jgi:hypothetical protein